MDTLEERVREGLQQLAREVEHDVDIETLISDGEQLRHRRRSLWTVGGIAAGATAVLLAWPSLAGRPVSAVPDPVGTPTSQTTPSVRQASGGAALEFSQWDPDLAYDKVEVDVARTGDDLEVEITAVTRSGSSPVAKSYTATADAYWSVSVADDLVVAIVPEQANAVTSVGGDWEPVDSEWLHELELTVVAVQRDAGDEDLQGLTWQTPDGEVHSNRGETVSAELTLAGGTVVVYQNESLQIWGYIDHANDMRETQPLYTEPVGTLFGLSATSEEDYFLDFTSIGLLPPGGTDPELTLPQDGITWTSAPLGDTGQIVLLIAADRIKQGQPPVESVIYTNTEGKRVTYRP